MHEFKVPKFPVGYHPRISGAAMHVALEHPVTCEVCKSGTTMLIGFEKEHEQDLWVCSICYANYMRRYA